MSRLLAAALVATALGVGAIVSTSSADEAMATCDWASEASHVTHVERLARHLYRPSRWRQRPETPGTSIQREYACAPGAADRMDQVLKQAREELKRERNYQVSIRPPGPAVLSAIAACESGGDPHAVSASGSFRGKFQFDFATWRTVGGTGDPAAAPEREQDRRAAKLYRQRGSAPWPICGR